ncbi:MAG: ABC transporter ATP-binding protein [Rhodoglobus sp.]
MRSSSVLAVENVSLRVRHRDILADVTFDVDQGQRIAIVGSNGAGKSSLMRILSGLTQPTTGRVLRPARLAYVPERFDGPRGFAVSTYLGHMAAMRGLDKLRTNERVDESLSAFGLVEFADVLFNRLSKGTAQRVGLAQAFLAQVDLLLFDEPASGLTSDGQAMLEAQMRLALRDGTSIIICHLGDDDSRFDRTLTLSDGKLVGSAEQTEPESEPLYRVAFFSDGRDVDLGAGATALSRSDREVTVVVRSSSQSDVLQRALAGGWRVTSLVRLRSGEDS